MSTKEKIAPQPVTHEYGLREWGQPPEFVDGYNAGIAEMLAAHGLKAELKKLKREQSNATE